ncbi:SEC14-like protein 4 [Folsomia candida]|nr:SEC14-like protein 4 [Folsomia candida]
MKLNRLEISSSRIHNFSFKKMSAPTSDELQLIEIFRRRLINVEDDLRDRRLSAPRQLLRWIRARENDLVKAEEMLRNHLAWRKLRGIGPSLLQWTAPPMLTTTYSVKLVGFDKEGSPILFLPFGSWDIRQALEKGHKEAMVKYKDKILEQIMQLMHIHEDLFPSSSVTQFIAVSDWEGFSLRYIMNKEVVEIILDAARSFEANYPETLKSGFNINCPKVFTVLFNLIKPFLTERTLSKISIFDSNSSKWRPQLEKVVDLGLLPEKYGGSREKIGKISPTPWDLHNLRLEEGDPTLESIILGCRSAIKTSSSSDIMQEEDLTNIRVAPGYKVHIPVKVARLGDRIRWYFRIEEKDISFSVVQFQPPETMLEPRKEVVPPVRVEGESSGSHICEAVGDFAICFDNSYSTFKAKFVEYRVAVDNPFGK